MLKTLQRVLKLDRERIRVPQSLQQNIPVRHIWPDGIFLCGNRYTKCWRYTDINYAIASKEDKTSMFLDYSDLLNSFDSEAVTKISIIKRRINFVDFERTILLQMQDDGLDDYRNEINQMLREHAAANGNIVEDKYITVSVPRKSIEEARIYFARISADLTTKFGVLSSRCTELDATERLRIFHDFYRSGEETSYHFDLKAAIRNGHSFKDYICADNLEFKHDHFMMGNRYGRVIFLRDYANYIKDSMVTELYSLNQNLVFSIDVIPIPTDEAVREVEGKLLGVETNIANWQRRQNQNNNFSAVIPYDMEQQRKEAKEFLDDLVTRDQRMMFAEQIGVTRQAVAKWENGDSLPDILNCEALADFFDVSLNELVRYDQKKDGVPIGPRNKHIFGTVTIGERGQIVLPKKARDTLMLQPGDTLVVLGDTTPATAGIALVSSDTFLRMTGKAVDGFFAGERE